MHYLLRETRLQMAGCSVSFQSLFSFLTGRTVETNTAWGQESMREEMEKILSEKLAVLQRQLEMTQQEIPPMKEMTNT